jgi:hypothetical protein
MMEVGAVRSACNKSKSFTKKWKERLYRELRALDTDECRRCQAKRFRKGADAVYNLKAIESNTRKLITRSTSCLRIVWFYMACDLGIHTA